MEHVLCDDSKHYMEENQIFLLTTGMGFCQQNHGKGK